MAYKLMLACCLVVKVMHSQMTEYSSIDLCLDRETQLLMAASREVARTSLAECVSLHSLSAEAGMFANRGRLPLPPPALRPPVATNPPEKPMATQVGHCLHTCSAIFKVLGRPLPPALPRSPWLLRSITTAHTRIAP